MTHVTTNNDLVARPDKESLRALRRVQAIARTRPSAEASPVTTRRSTIDATKHVTFTQPVMDAVKAAAAQLIDDLWFEHIGRVDRLEDKLWEFVERCQSNRKNDQVSTFVSEHGIEPTTLLCRVTIDHLVVESPVDLLGVRLAPLEPELASPDEWPSAGDDATSQAEVEVTGTNHKRMSARARAQVERALRIMRVAIQEANRATPLQLRFQAGSVAAFDQGTSVWTPTGVGAHSIPIRSSDVENILRHPAAKLDHDPTNGIEQKADVALRWIDRAAFTADPLVSLLYQFFALEALLGDKSEGLKGPQLAFRRAMLAHAVTQGFRYPSTTLYLYSDVRNNAVHGTSMPNVTRTEVRAFAADVRSALRDYLELARSLGIKQHGKLMTAIDEHPDRADLIEWIRQYGGDGWAEFIAAQTRAPIDAARSAQDR